MYYNLEPSATQRSSPKKRVWLPMVYMAANGSYPTALFLSR